MSELPADLDPEELNEMIRDLGREKGLPPGISPDLIGPDPDDHNYWGCGQAERHKQSVAWRGKLIAELVKSPEWIAEWRAARELDQRIRRMCEALTVRAMGVPALARARSATGTQPRLDAHVQQHGAACGAAAAAADRRDRG